MNVIVSSLVGLRERYGSAGLMAVEQALNELAAARATAGIGSLRYMIEQGVPDLRVDGTSVDWQAIAAQLSAIAQALRAHGDRLESVLVIGGPRIVPFGMLANPVQDHDRSLPVDCVYGAEATPQAITSEESSADTMYGLDWPVGRLPDVEGALPTMLVQFIRAAADQHRRVGISLTPGVCYSAASWQVASQSICDNVRDLAPTGGALQLMLSPPTTADRLDHTVFDPARLIYCNLHGLINVPSWYGQSTGDGTLVPALRPSNLRGVDLTGAVFVSAACYGAALNQHTLDSSLALMVLSGGAIAFLGSLVITYGPLQPPSSEADLFVLHLLRQLYGQARTIGDAFLGARVAMMREIVLQRGYLDDDDAKTLLGFLLYGDPTLRIGDGHSA